MRTIIFISLSVIVLLLLSYLVAVVVASKKARAGFERAFPNFALDKIYYLPLLDEYRLKGLSLSITEIEENCYISRAAVKDLNIKGADAPVFSKLLLEGVVYGDYTFNLEADRTGGLSVEGSVSGLNGSFKADFNRREVYKGDFFTVVDAALTFDKFTLTGEAYLTEEIEEISRYPLLMADRDWLKAFFRDVHVVYFKADYKDNGFFPEHITGEKSAYYPYSQDPSRVEIRWNLGGDPRGVTAEDIRALFTNFCVEDGHSSFVGEVLEMTVDGEKISFIVPACGGAVEDYDDWDSGDCSEYEGTCEELEEPLEEWLE